MLDLMSNKGLQGDVLKNQLLFATIDYEKEFY